MSIHNRGGHLPARRSRAEIRLTHDGADAYLGFQSREPAIGPLFCRGTGKSFSVTMKAFHIQRPVPSFLAVPVVLIALGSVAEAVDHPFALREAEAAMTVAPVAPPPIGRRVPTVARLRLEARETSVEIAPGVTVDLTAMNGTVPGPMIRVFEGDTVEVTFANHPDSDRAYRIDFHAATEGDGTQAISETAPGQETTFSFGAGQPGLFLYRGGSADPAEVTTGGMAGLMLVEPVYGFRRVDREYHIMQEEFSANGEGGPAYVVLNGREGSLTGGEALQARTGERIRLYVGNSGPSRPLSLEVEGETQEFVYGEGAALVHTNAQTTRIPAGGTAMIDLDLDVPGEYAFLDQGVARGLLRVEGEAVDEPGGGAAGSVENGADAGAAASGDAAAMTPALQEKIAAGEQVYARTCIACHQATGVGIPYLYPPLAKSDYLIADLDRAIKGLIKGQMGEMTVRGQKYNMLMPAQMLDDEEIAQVLTYVLHAWGNPGGEISLERVIQVRESAQ